MARLAKERRTTMANLLDQAIADLEREALYARMRADLERLRSDDPEEWESYRAEGRQWEDATIADGLASDS